MEAEAGQSLDTIILRKDLERAAGDGIFYWGIGNALGSSLDGLLGRPQEPKLLFSVMRSKPKRSDVKPDSIFLWNAFDMGRGLTSPLPPHVLLLSRGNTPTGPKQRHYALVCQSAQPLVRRSRATLDLAHFRNLGSSSTSVGSSQVTAIIEHLPVGRSGTFYDICLHATLVPPYFVRLADPVSISLDDHDTIASVLAARPTAASWRTFVATLRDRAASCSKAEDRA